MTPDAYSSSPFHHLDPSFRDATKAAHITLTVIGTLLLAPAALVIGGFWSLLQSNHLPSGSDEIFMVGSALIGSISGGFAWCALCLLFFKRCDLRWHRTVWTTCAIFGYLTSPCIAGWIIWLIGNEFDSGGFLLLLFGIFFSSVACMVIGHQNARLAIRSLRRRKLTTAWT